MPAIIGPQPRISARAIRVQLQNPGPNVPDGDGGYTSTWIDLSPPFVWAHIETPIVRAPDQTVTGGAIATIARRLVMMPYQADVTTQTRIVFNGRTLMVDKVDNLGERNASLELTCHEVTA
jgi:head-tail adaptor